jgi:hypothetical protein
MKPVVAIVSGFLGAGKTTLILKAARLLQSRGARVAAILNDQGSDLVDTALVRQSGIAADQVSGGCFCCRFPDLIDALQRLESYRPEVIFAEAVGSCTDIVATTLRPLMRDWPQRFRVAPLTVLVHEQPDDADLRFLFDRQTEEADMVIDREIDVTAWVDRLLSGGIHAGRNAISVDYARYAQAEAALGWLNARVEVRTRPPLSPAMLVGPLIEALDEDLTAAGIRIVHLKMLDQCETGYVKAALTGNGRDPAVEGVLDASPATVHGVLLNLRALGAPDELRTVVEGVFAAHRVEWRAVEAFRPAAPVPFHLGPSNSADTAPAGSSITQ